MRSNSKKRATTGSLQKSRLSDRGITMSKSSTAETRYVDQFKQFSANGGKSAPAWLKELREDAIGRFENLGFPTTRNEEWRFTSVKDIVAQQYELATKRELPSLDVAAVAVSPGDSHRIILVNGKFVAGPAPESLPDGVAIHSLGRAFESHGELVRLHLAKYSRERENVFAALNAAFITDGVFVFVPPEIVLDRPIEIIYVSTSNRPMVCHPRCLVIVGRGAKSVIIENFTALEGSEYFTNAVSEVVLDANADIGLYRIQREATNAHHVATTQIYQSRDSRFSLTTVAFGAALARHDIQVVLDGEGAECSLRGVYSIRGSQHTDHHTVIDHAKPHCNSFEHLNGVMDDSSRGVFNGRIIVRKGAQKTDAKQNNGNLLLTESARADSQPQLEIYADDVRCTHGATLGPLDQQSLFYLESRGIGEADAKQLLTYGFGAEVFAAVPDSALRERLNRLLKDHLGAANAK